MKDTDLLDYGVEEIDGYLVPDAFRYDPVFLSKPRELQVSILQYISSGTLVVKEDTAVSKTVRRTVRLFTGQWEKLGALAEKCHPYSQDKRRNITENAFLRQFLSASLALVAPHVRCEGISTEEGLRTEIIRAFREAGRENIIKND